MSDSETKSRRKMTPEEKLAIKRDDERKRRAKWTEEKRQLENEKKMWKQRMQRGHHPSLTPEKLKQLKEKYGLDMEKVQKDQEKLEEMKRKKSFWNMEKRMAMTKEEKEEKRKKDYFYRQAFYAEKGRYWEQPEEFKQKRAEQNKTWRRNLTPEGRKRYDESLYAAKKKYFAKLLGYKNPDDWIVDGELSISKLQTAYWKRVKKEQPEKWREHQQKNNEYQKKLYQNESEEDRKRRRFKDKVNGVKRKLRKKLEQQGVAKKEVEARLNLVHEQMWKEFDPEWSWEKYGQQKRKRRVKTQEKQCEEIGKSTGAPLQDDSSSTVPCSENVVTLFKESTKEPLEKLEMQDCAGDWMENEQNSPSSPASPVSPAAADESDDAPNSNLVRTQKPTSSFPCSHCVLAFNDDSDLRNHLRSSHSDKTWTCPKCMEVVLSPKDLALHFQSFHKAKCDPEKGESSEKVESVKIKDQQSIFNFSCMRCPLKANLPVGFQTRAELFAHVKLKHRQHFWPCEHCQLLKYSKPALELHLKLCRLSKF